MNNKICTNCKEEKSLEAFYPDKRATDGKTSQCKDCQNYKARNRHASDPNIIKNKNLSRRYGIKLKDYNEMFAKQEGCCAICGTHQSDMSRVLCVDHDHKTDKVRELLCVGCNAAIGNIKESIETLQNAINYLKRHQK